MISTMGLKRYVFRNRNSILVTMKIGVLLCGTNEAGKTRTAKAFFKVSHVKRLKPMQLLTRIIAGKKVYDVSLSSPKNSEFCQVDEGKKRLEERTKICEQQSQGQDYVLIIPFEIYYRKCKNDELNVKCIIEPILSLKSKRLSSCSRYIDSSQENARLIILQLANMS